MLNKLEVSAGLCRNRKHSVNICPQNIQSCSEDDESSTLLKIKIKASNFTHLNFFLFKYLLLKLRDHE